MSKCFGVVLTSCALVGLVASTLEARPGGRGGARGAARPRGDLDRGAKAGGPNLGSGPQLNGPNRFGKDLNTGNGPLGTPGSGKLGTGKLSVSPFGQARQPVRSNARVGAAQDRYSQLHANFSSKNEPFSSAWYADHPNAWQYAHPHADAWAVASLGATAAWLGAAAVYPGAYVDDVENVYTSDEQVDEDEQVAEEAVASEELTGAELAARGAVDVPDDAEFMPLGVFALAPAEHTEATSLVQLAVTHDGIVRGSYVDLLSDQEQTIVGAVDKVSQRVAWTLGERGPVVFETTLETLTQPEGPVVVQFADGRQQQYTLARFESRTSDNN